MALEVVSSILIIRPIILLFVGVSPSGKAPDFDWLLIWFVIGCVLSWIGVTIIHKYENSYAKVM